MRVSAETMYQSGLIALMVRQRRSLTARSPAGRGLSSWTDPCQSVERRGCYG